MEKKINIKYWIAIIFVGITLGAITEYALILDIKSLIKIMQSFVFWGLIIFFSALFPKKYSTSILTPLIIMTLMNATYYLIRLNMSGYTNLYAWKLYTIIGIAGSIYIGTVSFLIKDKIINKKVKNSIPKFSVALMTIGSFLLTIIFINSNKLGNSLYYTSLGIIIGFILGVIVENNCTNHQSDFKKTLTYMEKNDKI